MKIQIAALAVGGIMLAAAGCGTAPATSDPNLTAAPSASGKAGATSKAKKKSNLVEVTYKITGRAARGMISYTTPSGQEQVTKDLPWQKKLRVKKRGGEFLSISVQNKAASGDVICQIYVDGKQVKRARSTGAYAIASCDHMLGF